MLSCDRSCRTLVRRGTNQLAHRLATRFEPHSRRRSRIDRAREHQKTNYHDEGLETEFRVSASEIHGNTANQIVEELRTLLIGNDA